MIFFFLSCKEQLSVILAVVTYFKFAGLSVLSVLRFVFRFIKKNDVSNSFMVSSFSNVFHLI